MIDTNTIVAFGTAALIVYGQWHAQRDRSKRAADATEKLNDQTSVVVEKTEAIHEVVNGRMDEALAKIERLEAQVSALEGT